MIEVRGLQKSFTSGDNVLHVLKGVDFTVESGDFVSIMGRSGEGKSTLLYQLGLLDEPTDGEVLIKGVKTSELNEKQRTRFRLHHLGFVFQDYALLPELTSEENVMIPLLMRGESKKAARKQALIALEQVEMEERATYQANRLSGGEKQRVAIARSIVTDPEIIYADEPTASLDAQNAHRVLQIFERLNKQGQTIVMVTHEDEFAAYSKRIIRLQSGHISDLPVSSLNLSRKKVVVE